MLQDFFEYWSEHNPDGKKMRWEMEKVFDINRRLTTWSNNQTKYKPFQQPKEERKIL